MENNLNWIDIGVNLTNKRFDHDRAEVIAEAQKLGVKYQIVTGTSAAESQKAFQLCRDYPETLFATAGCHPHDAKHFTEQDLLLIRELLDNPQVVAVGECGLDFNRNFSPPEVQIKVFEQQLELAAEQQKPLFLHEREAFDAQYQRLKAIRPKIKGAVVHCFTGDLACLKAYLDLDFYIGITGWICDERRGKTLYEIARYIPDDRLMIETDAPYLTPRNIKPKPKSSRNLPSYLPYVAQTLAEARGVSLERLSKQCYRNSLELFNLEVDVDAL